MKRIRDGSLLLLLLFGGAWLLFSQTNGGSEEQLWHYRNLGKAFYENPTTQYEAVEQFRKAFELAPDSPRERLNYGLALLRAGRTEEGIAELEKVQEQDPSVPHTWFNLGIIFKKRADYERAQRQFEKMIELAPSEPISHYNLGVVYRLTGKPEQALRQFEIAAALDPNLAGPHFQLYNAYRAEGRTEEANKAFETFRALKARQAGAAIPEDLEWSYYSEIYDPVEPLTALLPTESPRLRFKSTVLGKGLEGEGRGLLALDADAEGSVDLLVWSSSEVRLYLGGSTSSKEFGLANLRGVHSMVPGDYDNDGMVDLCILSESGPALYHNQQGVFRQASASLPQVSYRKAEWLDFDHDSDLDLFLLGPRSTLMRNNGDAGFSDHSDEFPFVAGEVLDAASFDLVKDTNGVDLLITYSDRPGVLYRDRLGGRFQSLSQASIPAGSSRIEARDMDNDGWTDLLVQDAARFSLLLNREGTLAPSPLPMGPAAPLCLVDLMNRGFSDLVRGDTAHANLGLGRFGPGQDLGSPTPARAVVSADFNRDGLNDLALLTAGGQLVRLDNQTDTDHRWVRIELEGVRNPQLAPGAEVEVKAGSLYQKRTYQGLPLHFGLGRYESIDTVRITWPNGLIQNESQQPVGQSVRFKEQQRLSGSCPMIFTWNGRQFEFIADVLGVAPLGASAGEGKYFPTDHDEYIQISSESLVVSGGHYEVRITEELREVGYIDQIKLLAVDHPAEVDIFTSEKFKAPPYPEFRLFGVRQRQDPVAARDHRGENVLPQILRRDHHYADGFRRDSTGVAERHYIELDFGPRTAGGGPALLVLHGWVDWADGSTFLRSLQEGNGLFLPYLQVLDEQGRWRTVIEDMGLPAGKPKTIVVDLKNKFLSAQRKIRIATNLSVYWDEIFLSAEDAGSPPAPTDIPLERADLRFRGFSTPLVHPERREPESYDYSRWMPASMWNPASGLYTRFGDVLELLESVDDRFVIMGSGDELRLLFEASHLPPLRSGFRRTFLLYVNGWAKDGDLNTAFSGSVEPLPFHGMSGYPYPASEKYPDDEEHRRYREQYNTRPALRLIRPLNEVSSLGSRGSQ